MSAYKIRGTVTPGYESVKKLFEENFKNQLEAHAQVCVYVDGRRVVDLSGSIDDGRAYDEDTLTSAFSCSKNFESIAIATLVDQGLMKYTDKIVNHWPEYGNNCPQKYEMTIEKIMRYEGGMPELSKTLSLADIQRENIKQNSIGDIIENQALQYPENELHSITFYHPMSRGFILNEIFRRVDTKRRTMGEWIREDIALALKTDTYIGITEEEQSRSIDVTGGSMSYVFCQSVIPKYVGRKIEPNFKDLVTTSMILQAEMNKIERVPPVEHMKSHLFPHLIPAFNNSEFKAGEVPSTNGQCTARGLAKVAAMMANKGQINGVRILSEKTWELFHSQCKKRFFFPFKDISNFTLGGVNHFTSVTKDGILFKNNKYRDGFYGWHGIGGSVFQWHPELKIGFSYVPTFLAWEDFGTTKAAMLQKEVVDCVKKLSR